jgi:acyl-CoA hydrolase
MARAGVSAEAFEPADFVNPGDTVAWPQGLGEPTGLTSQLVGRRAELSRVSVLVGMSTGTTLAPEHADHLTMLGLNGAGTNRVLVSSGAMDVIPVAVSAIPRLLRTGRIKVDVVLLKVRPHTDGRHFTTGVVADFTRALVESARTVVAEIDDRLPLTGDDALIPTRSVDHVIGNPGEIAFLEDPAPTQAEQAVAERVASVVPDRAVIQLGIGSLPVAVAQALSSHKDLGLHSGSLSDSVVDLIEAGVITNAHKEIDSGRSVTGCLLGTQRLLDFADANDELSMRSSDYTHEARTMSQLSNFHSVNSALEIDLSGQANAEVANGRYLGAVGGQLDFVRGAQASPGGRSIIAMTAATPDGTRSRVVSSLAGRPVTTPRSDIDVVITEFGVAELRGCSLRERARRLIAIAHPTFRDALAAEFALTAGGRRAR